jgi:hypothetical protein
MFTLMCAAQVVSLRYLAAHGLSLELCFPVSRSWVELSLRQERRHSAPLPAAETVTAVRVDGPWLQLDEPSATAPTLCDFGAGSCV